MNREKEQVDKGWERMKVLLEEELPPSSGPVFRFGWWSTIAIWVVVLSSLIPHYRVKVLPFVRQTAATQSLDSKGHTEDTFGSVSALPAGFQSGAPSSSDQVVIRVFKAPFVAQTVASTFSPIPLPVNVLPEREMGIASLSSLPTPPSIPLVRPAPSPKKVVEVVKSKPTSRGRYVHLGLLMGANFFQVKQMPGFLGGFSVDLGPRHQRWGLQTGLIYRSQVFSGESRPVIPVTYQNFQSATGHTDQDIAQLPNSSLLINTANRMLVPVIKSHQLETPVLLFYEPFAKFRLYAGATFMRHIWIESADRSLFTYDLRVVQNPSPTAGGSLSNELINQLSPWERNWQLGMSYTFFHRLELGLFYRSTMRPSPALADVSRLFDKCYNCRLKYPEAAQRTQESLRPQAVQLNLRYRF
jgi:hypothetical protein